MQMPPQDAPRGYPGRCYCGGVTFEIAREVQVFIACYCHCESCRRAHAAPLYHVVYIPPSGLQVVNGRELIKEFQRGPDAPVRVFCANCGSRLWNRLVETDRLGFFPALLEDDLQHQLPGKFRPALHHLSNETVLDLECWSDGCQRHVFA
eukprot:TRINITY_DN22667_c0_g1_i2.p2 TRINITY_DN22667_c0_g1~~TRINITY_DN22667_c0_g1_i2.p2  ORF type:complete len:150 (+),score=26.55 TRINITY_DN22667_c0_g1_i2:60-509(+)